MSTSPVATTVNDAGCVGVAVVAVAVVAVAVVAVAVVAVAAPPLPAASAGLQPVSTAKHSTTTTRKLCRPRRLATARSVGDRPCPPVHHTEGGAPLSSQHRAIRRS